MRRASGATLLPLVTLAPLVTLLTLVTLGLAPPDRRQTPREDEASEPPPLGVRVARLFTGLEEITGPEFEAAARAAFAEDREAAMRALVLRAGRAIPPGLTEASVRERTDRLRETVAWIAADRALGAEQWSSGLDGLLFDTAQADLWCAAARVVGELAQHELSSSVAAGLGGSRRVRHCAQGVLNRLYLRWFDGFDEFLAFREEVGSLESKGPYYAALQVERERARALDARLMELEPLEHARRLLDHPDPKLRVQAAQALGRGVGRGTVPAAQAIEALSPRLVAEVDAQALKALTDALLQLLSSMPPDSPQVKAFRDTLLDLSESVEQHLEWPVLAGLAGVPWDLARPASPEAEGGGGLYAGIGRVTTLLNRMIRRDEPLDSDLVVLALDAWRVLCERANGDPNQTLYAGPARDSIEFLLVSDYASAQVRRAAAAAVPLVVAAADLPDFFGRLEAGGNLDEGLCSTLLGVMGQGLARLDPGSESAAGVVELLLTYAGDPRERVRARALGALTAPGVGPMLGTLGPAEIEGLMARLAVEPSPDLQWRLFSILSSVERPELVERVLALSAMDEFLRGDPRRIEELGQALATLAGSDAHRVFLSAQRMATAAESDRRLTRLEQALRLVASLSSEAASTLSADEHYAIVRWTMTLRTSSGAVGAIEQSGFLQKVVDVHLPRALLATAAVSGEIDLNHVEALFRGDRLDATAKEPEVALVNAKFAEALKTAGSGRPKWDRGDAWARVLRDRARFRLRIGRRAEALADYVRLWDGLPLEEAEGTNGSYQRVTHRQFFELSDLRNLGQLLVDAQPAEPDPLRAARSFEVTLTLVRQDAWSRVPGQLRVEDLKDLAARALASGEEPAIREARAVFLGLPALPAEGTLDAAAAGASNGTQAPQLPQSGPEPVPLWNGLLRQRAWHETLWATRQLLESGAPAELPAAGDAAEPAPEEGDGTPADPPAERDGKRAQTL